MINILRTQARARSRSENPTRGSFEARIVTLCVGAAASALLLAFAAFHQVGERSAQRAACEGVEADRHRQAADRTRSSPSTSRAEIVVRTTWRGWSL